MKPSELLSHWREIRTGLISTIDNFDNRELTYKTFASSWSAGEIALHITNAEDGLIRHAVTRELDRWPDDHRLVDYQTKEAIKSELLKVHTCTENFLESLDQSDLAQSIEVLWGKRIPLLWILWHLVEHEIHHRGELSLILGLCGREGLDV